MRAADSRYRFIYVMGLKSDDSIFIFADSEPGDSPDYSPPGQNYAEASAGARRVFDNKTANVALSLLLQPFTFKPGVQKALIERDRAPLSSGWQPLFKTLKQENHLTLFYFLYANRVCLLRIHSPLKSGALPVVRERLSELELQFGSLREVLKNEI